MVDSSLAVVAVVNTVVAVDTKATTTTANTLLTTA
jgi:hypothetical protein